MNRREFDQTTMVHRLPAARAVDRIDELVDLARGRRVIHVGFADEGCRTMQARSGTWLHAHLDRVATSLVGLDVDEPGVKEASAAGYEAHLVDCTDREAVLALGLEPAQLVIAGEVIEHVDDPGSFLSSLHELVAPGGQLVVTTPNAYGWFNVMASLVGREVNHPDHVVMFTWRTLTNLAARHGWTETATCVYVPSVKDTNGSAGGGLVMRLAGRFAGWMERTAVRLRRPWAADGLLVVFRAS